MLLSGTSKIYTLIYKKASQTPDWGFATESIMGLTQFHPPDPMADLNV